MTRGGWGVAGLLSGRALARVPYRRRVSTLALSVARWVHISALEGVCECGEIGPE